MCDDPELVAQWIWEWGADQNEGPPPAMMLMPPLMLGGMIS
jgi:hypothetical protein